MHACHFAYLLLSPMLPRIFATSVIEVLAGLIGPEGVDETPHPIYAFRWF
jgi:hypothetical protein